MTRSFSLYLDALRAAMALVVLLSHFAYPRFSDGDWIWVRELNLGSDAVVVFFVLSGLVVAFAAETKDRGARQYAFARATRILSVALPALLLGFVLDRTGAAIAPANYANQFYFQMPLPEMLLRGLSFSNEWGWAPARLGTNGPYWSLSYEVGYYALFGVVLYASGYRRIALLCLGAVVLGPAILLLSPCWVAGVLLWRRREQIAGIPLARAWALALLPVGFYATALFVDLPTLLKSWTTQWGAARLPLRFSDEFLWNWVLAAAVAMHLAGVMALARSDTVLGGLVIRWLAGASFSIYLVHYPVLTFLDALLPAFGGRQLGLLLGTLVVCLAFASVFERPLKRIRDMLGRLPSMAEVRA